MGLFKKRKQVSAPAFPPAEYEPVIRCSICTGEQVAGFRARATGQFHEVALLRTGADLEDFCRSYGLSVEDVRKIY